MNFVVFSLGRTGTQWLTRVLNTHPKILAFHGPAPYVSVDPLAWDDYFVPLSRMDWTCLRTVNASVHENKTPRHFANVHGLDPTRWLEEPSSFSSVYRCIQLTRHPFARIDSMRRRWVDYDYATAPSHYEAFYETAIQSLREAGFQYPAENNLEDKMFVAACSHLFPHDAKFLRSAVPVFRTEDLSNPTVIEVMTIAACNTRWKSDDLEKALAIPPVNPTHKTKFTEAQFELMHALIRHFELEPIYEMLSYQLQPREGEISARLPAMGRADIVDLAARQHHISTQPEQRSA